MPTSDLLKSLYVAVCCGGFILACTVFVIVSRRSSISRAWLPLVHIVNGTLERKYMSAILRGTYQGHPIQATLIVGGAEDADTFRIEMTTDSRGTNWSVRYGSEKLFGKDQWYVRTSNDRLQQGLAQSGVLAEMQRWDSHPTVSYQAQPGLLVYEEKGSVAKPERFRAQLDLLLRLVQINQHVNTA
jgi:hypothetical protein